MSLALEFDFINRFILNTLKACVRVLQPRSALVPAVLEFFDCPAVGFLFAAFEC
jgi:hypothetical protein